jgi:hypothetical protein
MDKQAEREAELIRERNALRKELALTQEKAETIKAYVKSLESEIETKSNEILKLTKRLHKFELEEEELQKILTQ